MIKDSVSNVETISDLEDLIDLESAIAKSLEETRSLSDVEAMVRKAKDMSEVADMMDAVPRMTVGTSALSTVNLEGDLSSHEKLKKGLAELLAPSRTTSVKKPKKFTLKQLGYKSQSDLLTCEHDFGWELFMLMQKHDEDYSKSLKGIKIQEALKRIIPRYGVVIDPFMVPSSLANGRTLLQIRELVPNHFLTRDIFKEVMRQLKWVLENERMSKETTLGFTEMTKIISVSDEIDGEPSEVDFVGFGSVDEKVVKTPRKVIKDTSSSDNDVSGSW